MLFVFGWQPVGCLSPCSICTGGYVFMWFDTSSSHVLLQRLRLIEVFDVQRLQMRYATSSIG
jgi:hypothetical protein